MDIYSLLDFTRSLTFWIFNIALLLERSTDVNMAPVFNTSTTITALTQTDNDLTEGLRYMTKYGYIRSPDTIANYTDLINTIKEVQLMLHVNETGILDHPTLTAMRQPRCGVKDIPETEISGEKGARNRRYIVYWEKWNKQLLTYNIENYPTRGRPRLTRSQVDEAVHRATQAFSNVTRLKFKKVTGYADIRIRFESYNHGDGFEFDGEDGLIAHSFVPDGKYGDLDGDIHFDNSEEFTWEGDSGYNFYQTALHELGHSLGLEHSWHYYAVMFPTYLGHNPQFRLHEDDIRGIQLIYGMKVPNPKMRLLRPNAPCNIAYDAVGMVDGQVYIFKNKRLWRINGIIRMTPREGVPLKRRFKGLPSHIDAIYQLPFNGFVRIFKGNKYWVYRKNYVLDKAYPRPVTDFGLPDVSIDAVLIMDRFNKTYFFNKWSVWRYDEGKRAMDEGWPHYIAHVFPGIPYPVSAAFEYTDRQIYFVSKKKYFRYDNRYRNADPGYPRYFGQDWVKC